MPEPQTPDEGEALRRPASCGEVFKVFNRLSLQGFGGVLPIAQRELVENVRWMTRDEFLELLAVCQVLPGPNIVMMAMMTGDRFFGLRGAVAALGGMMVVPTVIVLVLAALYAEFAQMPVVSGALRGMGAVAAGLVLSTAFKLGGGIRAHVFGMGLCLVLGALTFVLIALLKWPLVGVLAALGPPSVALAWWRLGR
jgi:chromate transporter